MASTISREAERSVAASNRPLAATPLADAADPARPRILHVVTRYLRGGSEKRIRDMVRSYPEADHHVVVGGGSNVSLAEGELAPAEVSVLPSLLRRPDPLHDAMALIGLARILRGGAFDLLITHQSKAGALGRWTARRYGIPVIHSLSMASFGPGYPRWQDALFRWIESRLAPSTLGFAVVGSDLARRYAQLGVPRDRLHVIRSGAQLPVAGETFPHRSDVRRALGLPTERPLILYLGSLGSRKNVLDLPRYLDRVRHHLDGARPFLAVAGEGPLRENLRTRLEHGDGVTDAALLGYVTEPLPLVRAADLVILLSSAEGVCQALVQATAVGTPFVAYRVDGVGELLELGARGVAVPIGDLEAAASASAEMIRTGPTAHRAVDLSPWSPRSIAEGHRSLIAAAFSSTGRSPLPAAGGLAIAARDRTP
jgi:glycosyltransferase involved in cell wall biosynthesis